MTTFAEIETSRLLLRQFTESDIGLFCSIYGDSNLMRYMGNGAKSPVETTESIRRKIDHWHRNGYGLWCLVEKESGAVIGHGGLGWLDPVKEVEVAYLVHRPYGRRGFGTEATRASISYGFELLNLKRIVAIAQPDNDPSFRVMESSGMKFSAEVEVWKKRFRMFEIYRESYFEERRAPEFVMRTSTSPTALAD